MPRRYRHKSQKWTRRKVAEARAEDKYPLRIEDYIEEASSMSETPVQEPTGNRLNFPADVLKPEPELVPELVVVRSNGIKKVFNAIKEKVVHWRNKESA